MDFIGREEEYDVLEKKYKSPKFEFVVIYGRRQIGKTKLITTFCSDKKSIYFCGTRSSEKSNLERLSNDINIFEKGINTNQNFKSFYDALEYVFKLSLTEKIIFAIDEYPYIAKVSEGLGTILQLLIDKYRENSKLMLIISGSSVSYMEKEVMSYKAPLYGRRTAQIKMEPLSFDSVYKFLSPFSPIDRALFYGCVGGTPKYICEINKDLSFEDNIKELYLNKTSPLFNEPEILINMELYENKNHQLIIEAIANGHAKLSEIATYCSLSTSETSYCMKILLELGYVNKELPYGEKESKKSLYSLSDNMFRFWYRFIYKNLSFINMGKGASLYKSIEPYFSEYMGFVFEDICKQYLWKIRIEEKCPINFVSLGRWWGSGAESKVQEEIDIVGEENKMTALCGECKWTNEKVSVKGIDKLISRSKLLKYSNFHYYLFSKVGFTEDCVKKAQLLDNVTLVKYEDMF